MRFSAWIETEENVETITLLLSSEGQPKGTTFLYEIEAATWEEVQAVHHIRMGWGPYVPGGEPEMCPAHKSEHVVYYPAGSGQCWKCESEKSAKLEPTSDFDRGVERAAKHVEAHSCVSSCCHAQPSETEAAQLAACVRKIKDA